MDKIQSDCPYPGCFFCVMKEANPSKRRASVLKFFRELPSQDDDGQVLPISGLWNTAMAHPNDPEFINLGIFECMAALIWKGLKNRRWLAHDQNIYIPYYAAHIIGSYTMNMEEFAERAVRAGVIPPLVELLRGRLTWVEQRVAVRALGHLATYPSTFPAVADHGEVLELAIQLASSSLEIVYSHFYQFVDRRLGYHCDLLTRGLGGAEMESRKAEEWASQLQCWSLQLINCFAFKPEFLHDICKADFLIKLPGMWGGLVNENSPAGVGLLRTICQSKVGRGHVANIPGTIDALCNIARSSDDWQYMAVDCLIWLVQDASTCHKQNKVPDYAERLVKKQMRAAWLFREAALKHGGVHCDGDASDAFGQEADDSEWETASESDAENDARGEADDETEWKNDGHQEDFCEKS
nr:unnamed protein product [Digitaria exilis]